MGRTIHILLALAMILPVIGNVGAEPVSDRQATDIEAALGNGAPFGDWEYGREDVTFWLHMQGDGFQDGDGTGGAGTGGPQDPNPLYMDLTRSNAGGFPPAKGILVGSNDGTQCLNTLVLGCVGTSALQRYEAASFKTFGFSAAEDDNRIFSVESRLYFEGMPADGKAYVVVYEIDAAGARQGGAVAGFTLNDVGSVGGNPGVTAFEGGVTLATDGRLIEEGHGFEMVVGTAYDDPTNVIDPVDLLRGNFAGPPAVLLLDGGAYPSSVAVRSDSARVNVWTEDIDGRVESLFPSANINEKTPTKATDRQLLIHVVQSNAWGADQINMPGQCGGCHGLHSARLYRIEANGDWTQQDITSAFPDFIRGAQAAESPKSIGATGDVYHSVYHYVYPAGFEDHDGDATTPDLPITRDAVYKFETYSGYQKWKGPSTDFTIGKRGFEFELADGEVAKHITLVGEATEFALNVRNVGVKADTIGLALPASGAWQTSFDLTSLKLNAGEEQMVRMRVSPPADAGAGDSRSFSPSAASLINNIVKSLNLEVELTSVPSFGVDLTSLRPTIETRPGVLESASLQIRNTGNAADSFITSISGVPNGWSVSLTPASVDLPSQSRQDLFLRVIAPADAEAGETFILTIDAISIDDETVTDRLELPVGIFVVEGVHIEILDHEPGLRHKGASQPCAVIVVLQSCAQQYHDTAYDTTVLAPVRVTNTGDADETFTIQGFWDNSVGSDNSGWDGCGGCRDGIADGWRFNVDGQLNGPYPGISGDVSNGNPPRGFESRGGFSGVYTLGTLEVPAHDTVEFLMEIGHTEKDLSGASGTQREGPEAKFIVQVSDADDPSFIAQESIHVKRVGAGSLQSQNSYANAAHEVAVELELDEKASKATPAGVPIRYNMIARNLGNEVDTFSIRVDPGLDGWAHKVIWNPTAGSPDVTATFNGAAPSSSPKTTAGCSNPNNNDRRFICTMGAHDFVRFQVEVTPPAGADDAAIDEMSVLVTSQADSGVFDDISLETEIGGLFAYTLTSKAPQVNVVPGNDFIFPFTIRNTGNEDDTYIMELVEGPTDWQPLFSEPTRQVFVPEGKSYTGFLRLSAPIDTPTGDGNDVHFRIDVRNVGDDNSLTTGDVSIKLLDLFALPVEGGDLALDASPVLVTPGETESFQVDALDLVGSATDVTLTFNPTDLPNGWSISAPGGTNSATEASQTETFQGGAASGSFQVTAPSDELGTSRVMLQVKGTTPGGALAYRDVEFTLSSTFGVSLETKEEQQVILPGQSVQHTLLIKNTGLSRDTIDLSFTDPPTGWTLASSSTRVGVEPLQTKEVLVTMTAPDDAAPGFVSSVIAFGASVGDPEKVEQTRLRTLIGEGLVEVTAPNGTRHIAPEETQTHVVQVKNIGTVVDTVTIGAEFPAAYVDRIDVSFDKQSVDLKPGEAADILVTLTMPTRLVSNADVVVTITGISGAQGVRSDDALRLKVLPHAVQDVDGDGNDEFAVNRDLSEGLSFEEFRESTQLGGITVVVPDLVRFLSEDAIEAKTVTETVDNETASALVYVIDGDGDGLEDHFLDNNGDDLPDVYWDPDNLVVHPIALTKDVTNDGVRELFIDNNGDSLLDVYFDLSTGEFGDLLQVDLDGDGLIDYVVDLNGNGEADDNEPVLFSTTGGILIVEKVDVDGDGCDDQVFDINGDGNPDYFVPCGSTVSIPLKLRDITGDGVLDWTFDSNGDDRVDRYYDPATGTTSDIDTSAEFIESIGEYWYVAAIFGLVAVLFVVLLVVTRR